MTWVMYIVLITDVLLYFYDLLLLAGLRFVVMFTIDQQSPYNLNIPVENVA